jgi:hypothetical protein
MVYGTVSLALSFLGCPFPPPSQEKLQKYNPQDGEQCGDR